MLVVAWVLGLSGEAAWAGPLEDASRAIDHFVEVVPGKIYRGAYPTEAGFKALHALGVKTDISLIQPAEMGGAIFEERKRAAKYGVGLYFRPLKAGNARADEGEIEDILSIMSDPANYPLYIHCKHGRDRTGMVVGLYRVLVEKSMNAREAWQEMLQRGYRRIHAGLTCQFKALTGTGPSRLCGLIPHYRPADKWMWNPGSSVDREDEDALARELVAEGIEGETAGDFSKNGS
jgi:protein tyrosine/serine phosphatase